MLCAARNSRTTTPSAFPSARSSSIIADVIAVLAADIPAKLSADGLFLASGIISDKFPLVEQAAAAAGLELLVRREKRDWCAGLFRKENG